MSCTTTKKILFVDDDRNILEAVKRQFYKQYDIVTATNGPDGLRLIESSGPFAVLVADLRMNGMDGIEFLNRARQITPHSVCIVITGYAELSVAMDAINKEYIFRFLTKPCPPETLARAFQDALAQYRRVTAVTRYTYSVLVENSTPIYTEYSPGCLAVTGYSPQQYRSDAFLWLSIVLQQHRRRVTEQAGRILAGQDVGPIEYQIRHKNGSIRWMRDMVICHRDDEGRLIRYDGLVEDITERKQNEAALRESEGKFRNFVETSPDIVFRLTRTGHIDYISTRVRQLCGYEPDELVGNHILTTTPAGDLPKITRAIDKVLAGEPVMNLQVNQTNKAGGVILMEINAVPIEKDGAVIGAQGIMRDITERKQAEEKLKRANQRLKEHDQLKSEFVSTVSHELRTPLSIFKNIISNARAGVMGKISTKLRENFEMADENIARLARIIDDFLDISRIEAGKLKLGLEKLDLTALVTEVVNSLSLLAADKGIEMAGSMPGYELFVNADHDKLVQVLTNLIGNAIKFTPAGGHVNVEVIDLGCRLHVEVRDDGPGIDERDLAKVFDRFVQVKENIGPGTHGTGLGLPIAKELIEMHQGRIWVESRLGEGAKFCFILPKYTEQMRGAPEHPKEASGDPDVPAESVNAASPP